MVVKQTQPSSTSDPFIDIHQILPEEESYADDQQRLPNRPVKFRRLSQSFNRQVSLETGFSVLDKASKANKNERRVLSRNGKSLGGFASNTKVGEGRKSDFNIFRTKSTLNKQHSMINSGLPVRKEADTDNQKPDSFGGIEGSPDNVPKAGRYFAALRGPELDQVKDSEDILLPKDEIWPFLLRFPIGCFGICLGLSSQAILWGALTKSPATQFLQITPMINFALWLIALIILLCVSITYLLKVIFYFEAVRREFHHPVRTNFFFAPWIVCMFLAIGVPPKLAGPQLHPALWCAFMTPVFFLELKIYGQWLSGGKRRLSKVANPSSHLSVVGNFVGAILACKVGWMEAAKFFWAVGLAHYIVVFVTLYQRLFSSETLPKELHPVYSMFIATPAAASIAWAAIYGEFDAVSRTCYFIALFLYISLVVRISFFWGFRFSVAWWSYTFPMTTASLATIKYAEQVPTLTSKGLAIALSFVSSTMVSVLFISTLLHAFVWHSLFPNDLAIAITKKKINGGRVQGKEKKQPSYNKRWTKQSPLSLVSSMTKNNSAANDGNNAATW